MTTHYAVDFEAEYGDEISVTEMGARNYAHATNVFLVGIYGPGVEYVGPVSQAPWELISGYDWLSHNASFDETVFLVLQEKGILSRSFGPKTWSCTADLSAYCQLGRSLADAAKHGLGVTVSKQLRQRVKNKRFEDLKPAFQEDFKRYCLSDSELSWRLWDKYSDQWPEEEREFARIIRTRCGEGVWINQQLLHEQKSALIGMRADAAAQLPWGEPYLSMRQVRAHCALLGIEAPASLAEDSPLTEAWETRYSDVPIVQQVREYRKANIMLRKLEKMERRIMPEGRMHFNLKYHGAEATGRLSGTDGLNLQNLNREPYRGIDLRRLLISAEGMKFLIADFAQIEPRITAWVCGNRAFLFRLKEGVSFYEEDARASGSWNGEPGTFKKTDPNGYQAQKAESLGIAYGMGSARFCKAAKDQLNIIVEPWQAQLIIARWHQRNPGVKVLRDRIETDFKLSYVRKESYVLTLPSGRSLRYMDIGIKQDVHGPKYIAKNRHGSKWQYYWGGSLFENLIQATARDILRDAVLACERAGIPVRFTAHDEIVAEVPQSFDAKLLRGIMTASPEWAKGLPLDVEIVESQEYLK